MTADAPATRPSWQQRYTSGEALPWDSGVPDEHLVAFVEERSITGRALDVGCGTGTNARWLSTRGLDVVGIDLAPAAIERARAVDAPGPGRVRFLVHDILAAPLPDGPYDLICDRGCFHTFQEAGDRELFARRVAEALAPDGLWLSLIGSTEGPPRSSGPPRRTAAEIVVAIEPHLRIESLRAVEFGEVNGHVPQAWSCLARRRGVPAQPSTRWE